MSDKLQPECKTCGAIIDIPDGWSVGPAVRRHYWEQHPDRMQKTTTPKDQAQAVER